MLALFCGMLSPPFTAGISPFDLSKIGAFVVLLRFQYLPDTSITHYAVPREAVYPPPFRKHLLLAHRLTVFKERTRFENRTQVWTTQNAKQFTPHAIFGKCSVGDKSKPAKSQVSRQNQRKVKYHVENERARII